MPNHKTHDMLGAVSTLPVTALSYLILPIRDSIIIGIAHIFSTYMLSPDLDLHSRIYMRWGIFRPLWLLYQKLIPHRSFISHSYILSAIIRFLYIAWPILLFFILYDTAYIYYCILVLFGVVTSDFVHITADKIQSFAKSVKVMR